MSDAATQRDEASGREVAGRILLAGVMLPVQVTISLLFATGGLFLLALLGLVFSPVIGLFFLVRWAIRSR